ncbi:hypothetical protein DPMN_104344 [Dreissena polymorpha]|uniref:Cadherin domain-containing protein n=1 Tax=Dreissena polymorpha TaxID=45954 RepID=A0A9D4H9L5_DREPO|nr:hypothetical protein DPMN_104344 [Dreissena polymorpha]
MFCLKNRSQHAFFISTNQILAEDPDIGQNGAIEYSFSPGTTERVAQTFRLDPNSGTITLAASLKDSGMFIYL